MEASARLDGFRTHARRVLARMEPKSLSSYTYWGYE